MTITKPNSLSSETVRSRWELDAQRSSIGFRVKLIGGLATVTGHFDDYSGGLDVSATPAITLTMDAASVQTGNRKRDEHLRSSDFFDVENHPQVQFVSESAALEGDTLTVSGRLSARGQSIPLNIDARVRHVDGELELEGATTLPHRELGMTWSPFGLIPSRSEVFVTARLFPVRQTARTVATGSAEEPR